MADTSEPREDFLSMADGAEVQAAQSKNPKVKASWLQIAEGYRRVAEQATKWHVHQGD